MFPALIAGGAGLTAAAGLDSILGEVGGGAGLPAAAGLDSMLGAVGGIPGITGGHAGPATSGGQGDMVVGAPSWALPNGGAGLQLSNTHLLIGAGVLLLVLMKKK